VDELALVFFRSHLSSPVDIVPRRPTPTHSSITDATLPQQLTASLIDTLQNNTLTRVIAGFRREADGNCVLQGYYAKNG
jgi:hypothetical protein